MKDPKIIFVIAGSNDYYTREINNYFLERKFEKNVICLGKIEYDFIPGVIALSDVCLSILGLRSRFPQYQRISEGILNIISILFKLAPHVNIKFFNEKINLIFSDDSGICFNQGTEN